MFLKALNRQGETQSWEGMEGGDPIKLESRAGSLGKKKVIWEEAAQGRRVDEAI